METLDILEKEIEVITKWFKENEMTVNPDKIKVMVLSRHKQKEIINLKTNEAEIEGPNAVILLGV